jgi:hypothetical protein
VRNPSGILGASGIFFGVITLRGGRLRLSVEGEIRFVFLRGKEAVALFRSVVLVATKGMRMVQIFVPRGLRLPSVSSASFKTGINDSGIRLRKRYNFPMPWHFDL